MRSRSAGGSSTGTTRSTVTPGSGSTPPPMSTTGGPSRSGPSEPSCWTRPTPPTPSGSSASHQPHRSCPPSPGSTSPPKPSAQRILDQPVSLRLTPSGVAGSGPTSGRQWPGRRPSRGRCGRSAVAVGRRSVRPGSAFPPRSAGVSVRHEASDERGAGTARTSLGGLTSCQQPRWAVHLGPQGLTAV
jgi:hypothetical protein